MCRLDEQETRCHSFSQFRILIRNLEPFGQTETICRSEEATAKEIRNKSRTQRLKSLLTEEEEQYEKELRLTNNEKLLVENVKKSLF